MAELICDKIYRLEEENRKLKIENMRLMDFVTDIQKYLCSGCKAMLLKVALFRKVLNERGDYTANRES